MERRTWSLRTFFNEEGEVVPAFRSSSGVCSDGIVEFVESKMTEGMLLGGKRRLISSEFDVGGKAHGPVFAI